jgi:hypothetical protein
MLVQLLPAPENEEHERTDLLVSFCVQLLICIDKIITGRVYWTTRTVQIALNALNATQARASMHHKVVDVLGYVLAWA